MAITSLTRFSERKSLPGACAGQLRALRLDNESGNDMARKTMTIGYPTYLTTKADLAALPRKKARPMTKKADRKLAKFIDAVFAGKSPRLVLRRDGSATIKKG